MGKIILQQWKSTSFTSWREFGWKNLVRFLRVPAQRISQRGSTTCWRSFGNNKATHIHVFWDCLAISKYWEEAKVTIEKIMRVVIPLGTEALYLGLIPDTVKGFENKCMHKILLLTCKKAITKRWLTKDPPSVKDWIKWANIFMKLRR